MKYPKLTCRILENKQLIILNGISHLQALAVSILPLESWPEEEKFSLLSFVKKVVWISEFNENSNFGWEGWEELTHRKFPESPSGLLIRQMRTRPVFHGIFFF